MSRKYFIAALLVLVCFSLMGVAQETRPATPVATQPAAATAPPSADTPATPAQNANTAPAANADQSNNQGFGERYPRYMIGAGDIFDLAFTYSPEFDQTLTVQPDGFVSLREAGDVHVVGLTVAEATQKITAAYSKILRDPVITIALRDFDKPYFIFSGDVKAPGRYDLRGRTTVTQAVALAGGFLESAKHSEVYLYRRGTNETMQVTKLNVKAMMKHADLSEDVELKPGDMLFVPQNTMSKLKGMVLPKAAISPTLHTTTR